MSKALVIAEKPSVAKDIAKALGGFNAPKKADEFLENDTLVITWAVGHLLKSLTPEELDPKYKAWKLEDLPILPDNIALRVNDKCESRVKVIKSLLKRSDIEEVINACDAGREGELIFREIVEFCKCRKPTKRLWLQSMTAESIRKGFATLQPGKNYDNLSDAAKCRSEADWLVGFNATRGITRRMKTRSETKSWSAGRVQTPTLALLVARELEILSFRPTPFWKLEGEFATQDHPNCPSHNYLGTWFDPNFKPQEGQPRESDWITDRQELERIMKAVQGAPGQASETRKPANESAPPLFDLTSLQREANKRFGMSAKSTLNIAQELYEKYKLITYPRTQSKCLPEDYVKPVYAILHRMAQDTTPAQGVLDYPLFSKAAAFLVQNKLENMRLTFNNKDISDHFAIIPTDNAPGSLQLKEPEAKIYGLILRRFLARFFPAAVWCNVERITVCAQEHFRSKAKYLVTPGWRSVYGRSAQDAQDAGKLPELPDAKAMPVRNLSIQDKAEETTPPARYSEATLLGQMEKAGKDLSDSNKAQIMKDIGGIGTPATRADIIETLFSREYAERINKGIKVTTKGIMLVDLLQRIETSQLTSAELTAEMELHLSQVEQGQRSRSDYMEEVRQYNIDIIEKLKGFDYDQIFAQDPPLGPCPLCGHHVAEHMRFYACDQNTGKEGCACSFIIWKDKNGRYLDRRTVSELLQYGQTEKVEGFVSNKMPFKAALKLSPDKTEVLLENESAKAARPTVSSNAPAIAPCPFGGNLGCQIVETEDHYLCQQLCCQSGDHPKNFKGFILPKVVCQRPITREECIAYAAAGHSEFQPNFISKYGKPFEGRLILQDTGRHRFEFATKTRRGKAAEQESESSSTAAESPNKKVTTAKKTTSTAKTKSKAASAGTAKKSAEGKSATGKKSSGASGKTSTPRKAATKSAAKAKTTAAAKTRSTKATAGATKTSKRSTRSQASEATTYQELSSQLAPEVLEDVPF